MGDTNNTGSPSAAGHTAAWAVEDNVEVHTVDTDGGVVYVLGHKKMGGREELCGNEVG